MLAVVAPQADCERRGRAREARTGKRYAAEEYVRSVSAIPAMIAACNGRYAVALATEVAGSRTRLNHRVVAQGRGLSGPGTGPAAEEIRAVLEAALGRGLQAEPGIPWPAVVRRLSAYVPTDPALVPRPLAPAERARAWAAANFAGAPGGQESPVAVWVLGPPCAGKSLLAARLAAGGRDSELLRGLGVGGQAVTVDGDVMRRAHSVYQSWVRTVGGQDCVQTALKSIIGKEKDRWRLQCPAAVPWCGGGAGVGHRAQAVAKGGGRVLGGGGGVPAESAPGKARPVALLRVDPTPSSAAATIGITKARGVDAAQRLAVTATSLGQQSAAQRVRARWPGGTTSRGKGRGG